MDLFLLDQNIGPLELERESLAHRAYRQIRADIISGVRPPGERLRIEKLKAIYSIGPTPIREALQKLSIDRLVVSQENRGFSVSPLDIQEFQDLNIARLEIEKIALTRSIELGDSVWESRVVAATYLMEKADATLQSEQGFSDGWELTNAKFHFEIVSACGSRWLLLMRQHLQDMCQRYRRSSIDSGSGQRITSDEHHHISKAVLNRDASLACKLIERHFITTLQQLKLHNKLATKNS